ncbi:GNAT family N-acetyltransferase [Ideonella sp.]|jgi:putative acetyltransferase|uniref:GNAT family N-acetyltransferase n=1 Tax=Ideonella sp. TaxID=1929293 RepID=UPI0037C17618
MLHKMEQTYRPPALRRIRSAECRDAYALAMLTQDDLSALQYGCPRLASPEWWHQRIRQALEGGRIFVAECGDDVLGMVTLEVALGNWFRRHVGALGLCVHPEHRRRGIGRQLLSFALDEANEIGLARVELTVWSDNTSAIGLYESAGFAREGEHPHYGFKSGRHCSALTMGLQMGREPFPTARV